MDMLRTCYEIDMQFDPDGQIIRRVRWYFVADDTPSFPAPQKFGSQTWQWRGIDPGGIGESAKSVRKFTDGTVPWPIKEPRLCEHTPVEWFDEGCPSDAPPLKLTPLGQAACCAPASGIFVGVKLRAYLYPPNKGGLYVGGTVRLARVYHLHGGVMPGATLVANPPTRVTGGVLVGATVRPKLIYHVKGGVLLTALAERKALLRGKGGTYSGATKELMLRKVLKGGFRSGGKFEGRSHHSFKGGMKSGGKVRALLPCMSWIGSRHSDYVLHDILDNRNWVLQNSSFGENIWIRPTAPFFHIHVTFITGFKCGPNLRLLASFQDQFTNPQMVLLSYDALTGVGLWQVPYSAHDYQGRLFTLTLPP